MVSPTAYLFFSQALTFMALHYIALQTYLYYYLPWFDIVMHTWGGYLVILGLLMLGEIGSQRLRFKPVYLGVILLTVMIAWEVFEYAVGLSGGRPDFVSDTISDFIFGGLGGVVAYFIHKR